MKGICTRLLAALTLVIATSSSALAFDFFGLLSDDEPSVQTLMQSVPADTAVFFGGHSNSDAAPFFDEYIGTTSEADIQELNELLSSEIDTPGLRMIGWLMEDYITNAKEGLDVLHARYGLAKDGAGIFYLHGATPVARFAVADEKAFWALLDTAAQETEAEPRTAGIEGTDVRFWRVTTQDSEISLELAVTLVDGAGTVALLNKDASAEEQAKRLGLVETETHLADENGWESLGDEYGFDQYLRGYIDIAKLTESLLIPENTSLGRDLQQLAPEEMAKVGGSLDASCREEIVGLTRQVPRFVMGGETFEVNADSMTQTVRMVLELTNPQVTQELRKLTGSLPSYSENATDKILGFALGIDADAMTPVATALWTQFTTAEFECDDLVEMQTQAQSVNPAMLGMVSGMAQGVKGAGAALYNLERDPASPIGLGGSVLLSISAEKPQTVAALISSSVPGMANLNIPANGDPVQVPVPFPNLPVYAAIKGKHLVVYTGEPAKAAADSLASEALNTRGTTSLTMNYQHFGDAMLTMLSLPQFASQMTLMEEGAGCDEVYAGFLQLKETPLIVKYRDNYTERGWEGLAEVKVHDSDAYNPVQPGQYQTETLNHDCSWTQSGTETLDADGTGQYVETGNGDQCELYVNEYRWEVKGNTIVQQGTEERSRDSCDAEWSSEEPQSHECTVVGALDNGFYCLYRFDDNPVLMRYTR